MIRLILHGCAGHMGQVVSALVKDDPAFTIVAGVDQTDLPGAPYPVYTSVGACTEEADVVVDFSVAAAVDQLLSDCVAKKLPLVLCTTGLTAEQETKVQDAAGTIALLKSANMSIGINLLLRLVKDITPALTDAGFDVEIVEKHHRRKLDAPSGTAKALAEAAADAFAPGTEIVYDRSTRSKARPKEEIGVSAVRGGTIVGEHDVIFAGEDEVITLSHSAYSRAIFAKGALAAAKYLAGKPAGRYDMSDVI